MKKNINEHNGATFKYKGFKCFYDPQKKSYAIMNPNGEVIDHTPWKEYFPELVDEYLDCCHDEGGRPYSQVFNTQGVLPMDNKHPKYKSATISESQLQSLIYNSIKRKLNEQFTTNGFFDDLNNMVDNPNDYFQKEGTQFPDDVCDWGRKVQQLGLELSRLCGQYRFNNEEVYNVLQKIEEEYNAVCGDLNTYGISNHWES